MKVPSSIRHLYDTQLDQNGRLKELVDARLRGLKKDAWHYESRLKEPESFTLKVESGRFENPGELEDFFACTIVVRNANEIADAEQLVREHLSLVRRRPDRDSFTFKEPTTFVFDDLRLYVRWKDDPSLPSTGLESVTFEVQVKTFLQHAWSIATHDLVYKTANADWGKERLAYQVKAMLEHAEVSIAEAEKLSRAAALAKTNRSTKKLKDFINLFQSLWDQGDLPQDVRRLAKNVYVIADAMSITQRGLRQVLEQEKEAGRGPHIRNLSPYGIVVQTLMKERRDQFRGMLANPKAGVRVLIPEELELPVGIDESKCVNAIFVRKTDSHAN